MSLHHAHGLEIGINRGAAHEFHAPAAQRCTDLVGQRRGGSSPVLLGFPLGKAPQKGRKAAVFPLDFQENFIPSSKLLF